MPTDRAAEAVKHLGLSAKPTTVEQMDVFREALELFEQRNNSDDGYSDLWKEYGWEDSLVHMRSKLRRVEQRFRNLTSQDLDDALDLLNYTVFFIRNVRAANPNGISESDGSAK